MNILAEGYLEYELQNISKPSYHRMDPAIIQQIFQMVNDKTQVATKNMKQLVNSASCSDNIYIFLKHLYLVHSIIKKSKMWKLYLLDNFSKITIDKLIKLCKQHKFDEYMVNMFVFPYLNYLNKLCSSCEVYTYCVHGDNNLNKKLFVFGIIALLKNCLQVLQFLKTHYTIIKNIYPIILDIYLLMVHDVKCMYQKTTIILKSPVEEVEDSDIIQFATQQIKILESKLYVAFQSEFVIENNILLEEDAQLTEISNSRICNFLQSNFKVTPIKRQLRQTQASGKENQSNNSIHAKQTQNTRDFEESGLRKGLI